MSPESTNAPNPSSLCSQSRKLRGRSVCRAASLSDLQPVRSEAQTETLLCPTELGQLGLNNTHTQHRARVRSRVNQLPLRAEKSQVKLQQDESSVTWTDINNHSLNSTHITQEKDHTATSTTGNKSSSLKANKGHE